MNRISIDEVRRAFQSRGCKLVSEKYENEHSKLEYVARCGHTHFISWNNFQRGKGDLCGKCAGSMKYTINEVKDVVSKAGCRLLSEEYVNNKAPLHFIGRCGHDCYESLINIKKGIGLYCEKCRRAPKYSYDDVRAYFSENGCVLLSTEYKNYRTKLRYIARCGHENYITFNAFKNRKQGRYCKKCLGLERNTISEIKNKFIERGCVLLDDTVYKNTRSIMHYIAKCGHENTCSYLNFINGKGTLCKRCTNNLQCENICFDELTRIFGKNVVRQKYVKFDDGKYGFFDFYIKDKNIAIEYNGAQHYVYYKFFYEKPEDFLTRQKSDENKRKYCKDNNIKLIEIDGRVWDLRRISKGGFGDFLNCIFLGV